MKLLLVAGLRRSIQVWPPSALTFTPVLEFGGRQHGRPAGDGKATTFVEVKSSPARCPRARAGSGATAGSGSALRSLSSSGEGSRSVTVLGRCRPSVVFIPSLLLLVAATAVLPNAVGVPSASAQTSCVEQTLAIGASAATPGFASLFGVATDSAGNIYAADAGNNTVYRFDAAGNQTFAIANPTPVPDFGQPVGVAVDPAGNIYVADNTGPAVFYFDAAGNQTLVITPSASTPAFDNPLAVAADGAGNVYVADRSLGLYRFDAAGNQTLMIPLTAATPQLSDITGIAADAAVENIYATDTDTDTVYRFGVFDCPTPSAPPAPPTAPPAPTIVAEPTFTG